MIFLRLFFQIFFDLNSFLSNLSIFVIRRLSHISKSRYESQEKRSTNLVTLFATLHNNWMKGMKPSFPDRFNNFSEIKYFNFFFLFYFIELKIMKIYIPTSNKFWKPLFQWFHVSCFMPTRDSCTHSSFSGNIKK